ncbi:MAG: biotin/lipoate A/B protein ligase family protein [Anaerolineales bacterium]
MSEPSKTWRLIRSPAASGASNMAVDEAILESVDDGASAAALRLYDWSPPCLSLGYAQEVEDVDLERLRARGWGLVRRPTGGRAILHADEITYAVIAPASNPVFEGGILESYQRLSSALAAALRGLGVRGHTTAASVRPVEGNSDPICFENPGPFEVTFAGRKLIGSAQVRRRSAVLQHGSLPLGGDLGRICHVLRYQDEADRERSVQVLRTRAATLSEILARPIGWHEAATEIQKGFQVALGILLEEADLTPTERAAAGRLHAQYADPEWTKARRERPPVVNYGVEEACGLGVAVSREEGTPAVVSKITSE